MGHPLVTVPVVVVFLLFQTQPFEKALFISCLVIGIIQIPVLVNLTKKYRKGKIESFDVSDRNERKKFYFLVLPLLVIVNLILFFTNQSKDLIYSFLFATILLFLMQAMNYFVKSSLHVAVNVYLGFLLFNLNPILGMLGWIFVLIIAWSRLELKKHTTQEIVCGFIIGALCGSGLLLLI